MHHFAHHILLLIIFDVVHEVLTSKPPHSMGLLMVIAVPRKIIAETDHLGSSVGSSTMVYMFHRFDADTLTNALTFFSTILFHRQDTSSTTWWEWLIPTLSWTSVPIGLGLGSRINEHPSALRQDSIASMTSTTLKRRIFGTWPMASKRELSQIESTLA